MISKTIILTLFALMVMSCSSLKLGNILETTALAGVGYATGGIAPGLAVGVTSVVANELEPEETVSDVQNAAQAFSYVTVEAFMWLVYFGIAYIVLRDIIIPIANQWIKFRRETYDRKHKED